MRPRMSSTRHAVVLTPSLTGLGKRPSLTPCHQVDLLTGIGPDGAMIELRRTKPVSGRVLWFDMGLLHSVEDGADQSRPNWHLAACGFGLAACGQRYYC